MILTVLSLIDLSLAGNLVVIVIFSGYENFVSKINTENAEDRPSWMGTLDFSGLKMKLIGSIVAISAISLLRAFMTLTEPGSVLDEPRMRWMVILHLTFVAQACCSPPWITSAIAPRSRTGIKTKGPPQRSGPFFLDQVLLRRQQLVFGRWPSSAARKAIAAAALRGGRSGQLRHAHLGRRRRCWSAWPSGPHRWRR